MQSNSSLNYKSIFEMITLPILIADSEKKIIFANESSLSLLDISRSDVSHIYLHDIFQLNEQELQKVEKTLPSEKSYNGSCLIKHKNNDYSQVQMTVKSMKIPLQTKLGYFIEMSDSKNIDLTDEDLKKIGNCTSKMAHDFSNPLAVLRIHCDNFSLLAKKNKSFSSQQVLDRVQTLSKATDRLSVINNELKKLSKTLINVEINNLMNMIESDPIEDFQH